MVALGSPDRMRVAFLHMEVVHEYALRSPGDQSRRCPQSSCCVHLTYPIDRGYRCHDRACLRDPHHRCEPRQRHNHRLRLLDKRQQQRDRASQHRRHRTGPELHHRSKRARRCYRDQHTHLLDKRQQRHDRASQHRRHRSQPELHHRSQPAIRCYRDQHTRLLGKPHQQHDRASQHRRHRHQPELHHRSKLTGRSCRD